MSEILKLYQVFLSKTNDFLPFDLNDINFYTRLTNNLLAIIRYFSPFIYWGNITIIAYSLILIVLHKMAQAKSNFIRSRTLLQWKDFKQDIDIWLGLISDLQAAYAFLLGYAMVNVNLILRNPLGYDMFDFNIALICGTKLATQKLAALSPMDIIWQRYWAKAAPAG